MGLLDSVIGMLGNQAQGGGAQPDLLRIVLSMLANNQNGGSGLGGLVEQFQRGGLGDVIGSWIGTGHNLPVSPGQLGQVLGQDQIDSMAQQTGLSQDDLLGKLSQLLPHAVDHATPEGQVPQGGLGDLGALLSRFG